MLGWDGGWWGGVGDEDGFTNVRKVENWIQLLCLKATAASKVKSIAKQMLTGTRTGRKQMGIL